MNPHSKSYASEYDHSQRPERPGLVSSQHRSSLSVHTYTQPRHMDGRCVQCGGYYSDGGASNSLCNMCWEGFSRHQHSPMPSRSPSQVSTVGSHEPHTPQLQQSGYTHYSLPPIETSQYGRPSVNVQLDRNEPTTREMISPTYPILVDQHRPSMPHYDQSYHESAHLSRSPGILTSIAMPISTARDNERKRESDVRHKDSEKQRRDAQSTFIHATQMLTSGMDPAARVSCQLCKLTSSEQSDADLRGKTVKNNMLENTMLWTFSTVLHSNPQSLPGSVANIEKFAKLQIQEKYAAIASTHDQGKRKKLEADYRGEAMLKIVEKMKTEMRLHDIDTELVTSADIAAEHTVVKQGDSQVMRIESILGPRPSPKRVRDTSSDDTDTSESPRIRRFQTEAPRQRVE